jgi:hypothetical protein
MGHLVNIAFQGGTHGNFLTFVIDKFSRHTKDINELPFTHNHTSHLPVNYSGQVTRYHPTRHEPYFENIDEPHILITIDKEDLLFIERFATIRAGDFKIDTSNDVTKLDSNFLKHFPWKEKFSELYNIDLEKTPNIPRFLLRDFYKLSFLDPTNSGYISLDTLYQKNKPKNTFCFPVSSFWDEEKFYDTLEQANKKIGLQLDVYDKDVYKLFHKNLHFLETRNRVNEVIDCIKNKKNIPIHELDSVEQAYISAWLEQTFNFITVPLHNSFFQSTLEINKWIEYYPEHYKAMNPNLPTFKGIPNPFHLWNLKK